MHQSCNLNIRFSQFMFSLYQYDQDAIKTNRSWDQSPCQIMVWGALMRNMSDGIDTGHRDDTMTRATGQGRASHKCATWTSLQLVPIARGMNRSFRGHAKGSPEVTGCNRTLTKAPDSKLNTDVHLRAFVVGHQNLWEVVYIPEM